MRIDSLSRFLTLGNVYSGSQVLVFETLSGLITAAVLDRLGGYGRILKAYCKTTNWHHHIVTLMNFDKSVKDALILFPVEMIGMIEKSTSEDDQKISDEEKKKMELLKSGSDRYFAAGNCSLIKNAVY